MASGWGRLICNAGLVIFEAGGFNRRKLSPPMLMMILNPQDFLRVLGVLCDFFYRDSLLQFPPSIPEHVIAESPMVFGGRSVLCDPCPERSEGEAISNSAGREKRSLLDPCLESSKREINLQLWRFQPPEIIATNVDDHPKSKGFPSCPLRTL